MGKVMVVDDGRLVSVDLRCGDHTECVDPSYVVIADVSLDRFVRDLGTIRRKDYPMGLAARGYYASASSDQPFLESQRARIVANLEPID